MGMVFVSTFSRNLERDTFPTIGREKIKCDNFLSDSVWANFFLTFQSSWDSDWLALLFLFNENLWEKTLILTQQRFPTSFPFLGTWCMNRCSSTIFENSQIKKSPSPQDEGVKKKIYFHPFKCMLSCRRRCNRLKKNTSMPPPTPLGGAWGVNGLYLAALFWEMVGRGGGTVLKLGSQGWESPPPSFFPLLAWKGGLSVISSLALFSIPPFV